VAAVSVLTLNLRFGLADDGPNGWEHRRHSVVKLFTRCAPDFIATQEANDFQVEYLAQNLPGYQYIGKRNPAPRFWQNNVLYYREENPCKKFGHFFLSETPDVPSRSYGSQFPRQATLGLFYVAGKPLVCLNTHFDFDEPAHMGAAQVIKEKLASFSTDIPVVLLGDFNTTPESACYRWFIGGATNGEAGMDFNETFKQPRPSTFHGFTGKPLAGHIDWILFRGPLRLEECRVLKGSIDGVLVSDHYPVQAIFTL
jgi:endonuclease/exonuclease/phosphatase family metal-dependent hydrolase